MKKKKLLIKILFVIAVALVSFLLGMEYAKSNLEPKQLIRLSLLLLRLNLYHLRHLNQRPRLPPL